MKQIKEYKSNDFYQAVVLKTVGVPLLRLERVNGKFFNFVFDDSNGSAEEIISKYWLREIRVDAKKFVENIDEFKTRIHSGI